MKLFKKKKVEVPEFVPSSTKRYVYIKTTDHNLQHKIYVGPVCGIENLIEWKKEGDNIIECSAGDDISIFVKNVGDGGFSQRFITITAEVFNPEYDDYVVKNIIGYQSKERQFQTSTGDRRKAELTFKVK